MREKEGNEEKELQPGLTYPNRGLTLESLYGTTQCAVEATAGESSKSPALCWVVQGERATGARSLNGRKRE